MIAEALRLPTTDTVTLVRINGGIQVVAGTMLALGKGRRAVGADAGRVACSRPPMPVTVSGTRSTRSGGLSSGSSS